MPGETINFELKVNSNIKRETQEAKEFHKTISAAAAAAQNIEYGRARGAMGSTGASARDFANQAQGLGGLVRLYATYAANIYAVSAAFNALSTAMNTANMEKGIEQLSASTGVSLGLISKQFVATTEGAISLRDAMQAVTKASAAGLSSGQILNISEYALKASQALGLDLNDAVNRLTRGITKLEPELLDELGIFTKIDPAVESYARSLGRATSSLSDFERRQAFAVAVLKELDEKFGKIQLQANPYDKLVANLKDLSTTALQVINTVVGPLVNFLNSSPIALAAAIGLLAKNVLGNFIPALKDYNTALQVSLEKAKDKYAELDKAARTSAQVRRAALLKQNQQNIELREEANYIALAAAEKQFSSQKIENVKQRANVERILAKDISDVTQAEVKYLDILKRRGIVDKDIADGIKNAVTYNKQYVDIQKQLNGETSSRAGLLTAEWAATTKLDTARRNLTARGIVQNTAATAQEQGLRAAATGALSDIKAANLGPITSAITGIGAAGAIAAEGAGRLVTALGRIAPWAAIITGAYQFLSYAMSTNEKQMAALTNSLDDLEKNTATAADVAKKFGDTLSIESLVAKANAMTGLADSIKKVSSNLQDTQVSSSGFDRLTDFFAVFIGQDIRTKTAKQVGPAIIQGIKNAATPEIKKELQSEIASILEIDPEAAENISNVIDAIFRPGGKITSSLRSSENFISIIQSLNSALDRSKKAANQLTAPLRGVNDGFKDLQKSYQELANTFVANDPLTRFAVNLNKQANLLNDAFKSSESQLAVLKSIAKDPSLLVGFPADTVDSFRTAIEQLKTAEADLAKGRKDMRIGETLAIGNKYAEPSAALQSQGITQWFEGDRLVRDAEARIRALQENLQKAIVNAANYAVTLINQRLVTVAREQALEQQKTLVGFLPRSPETAKLTTQLELDGIKLRREEIEQTRKLIVTNDKLRIAFEESALIQERDRLQYIAAAGDLDANARLSVIKTSLSNLAQEKLAYADPSKLKDQVVSPGALAIIGNTAKYQEELLKLAGQEQMIQMKGIIDQSNAEFDQQIKDRQRQLETTAARNRETIGAMFGESPTTIAARQAEFTQQEKALERQIKVLQFEKELASAGIVQTTARELQAKPGANISRLQQIESAAGTTSARLKAEQAAQLKIFDINTKLAATEEQRNIDAEQLLRTNKQATDEETRRFEDVQQSYALDLLKVEQARQDLNTRKETVGMTEEQFLRETQVLDRRQLQLETAKRIDEIDSQARQKQLDFERQIIALKGGDLAEAERLIEEASASEQRFKRQKEQELQIYNSRVKNMGQLQEYSARQKAYDDILKNSFSSMADAIVNWAQTGKWAGKDLFKSLTADLLRYELRLQMFQAYGGVRNTLLAPFASTTNTSTSAMTEAFAASFGQGSLAKGGAFDSGIRMYAKGGMFTNSIVDQPTLFKFAKGTGLMGEAGPEAIMPLKRDSQGNLGVRGGGQKTEVIINNYSNQPATTQETTDSRGNRKIEVVIGEVAAGDIGRSGSNSQRAMRGTFGLRPQLLRR